MAPPTPAPSSSSTADPKVKEKTEVGSCHTPFKFFHLTSFVHAQVDDIVEKIYANMSACHLKNKNWKRALETADKVGWLGETISTALMVDFSRPLPRTRTTTRLFSEKPRP
jgi:hypothetical protein